MPESLFEALLELLLSIFLFTIQVSVVFFVELAIKMPMKQITTHPNGLESIRES